RHTSATYKGGYRSGDVHELDRRTAELTLTGQRLTRALLDDAPAALGRAAGAVGRVVVVGGGGSGAVALGGDLPLARRPLVLVGGGGAAAVAHRDRAARRLRRSVLGERILPRAAAGRGLGRRSRAATGGRRALGALGLLSLVRGALRLERIVP